MQIVGNFAKTETAKSRRFKRLSLKFSHFLDFSFSLDQKETQTVSDLCQPSKF